MKTDGREILTLPRKQSSLSLRNKEINDRIRSESRYISVSGLLPVNENPYLHYTTSFDFLNNASAFAGHMGVYPTSHNFSDN
jgi:hypothetical protein